MLPVPAALRPPAELAAVADRGARLLRRAAARDVLHWAAEEFGDALAVTASMQDTVLVHLASAVRPGIDALFLDTGYHFAETLGTADAVEATYPVTLRRLSPRESVAEQDARLGPGLFARDPDACCALRKVAPLDRALARYEAWATGVRRAEAPSRADTPLVAFDPRRGKVKLAPLAAWTDEDVREYIDAHGVLVNPLLDDGYPSIGCAPCTRRVQLGEDPRAGRWAGSAKTECGIHT